MNRESESGIEYRLLNDGRLMIGTSLIEIQNLSFMEIIGSGANSLVFKAKHEYLDTIIAVKIWIKIKPGDKRDKFKQGIDYLTSFLHDLWSIVDLGMFEDEPHAFQPVSRN